MHAKQRPKYVEMPAIMGVRRNARELRALGVNVNNESCVTETTDPPNSDQVADPSSQETNDEDESEPDRVACAIAHALVDKFGEDIEDVVDDMAMKVTEVDPSQYKDMFENPKNFDEAWNHPDPFQ